MHPDDIALVPLRARDKSIRAYAIIDAADGNLINQWRWSWCGGYAARNQWVAGKFQKVILHRLLLGLTPGDGLEGDHINRNKLDNRRSNLRAITRREQTQNRGSHTGSMSFYRGVTWSKGQSKWRARIRLNGELTHLGYFTSETEAAQVARDARLRSMPYAVD